LKCDVTWRGAIAANKDLKVELRGFEPLTSCLPSKRSTN
jgi:hypothetical protein